MFILIGFVLIAILIMGSLFFCAMAPRDYFEPKESVQRVVGIESKYGWSDIKLENGGFWIQGKTSIQVGDCIMVDEAYGHRTRYAIVKCEN